MMARYLVLFDAEGTDDITIEYDQEPTQEEQELDMQMVGYYFGGYWEASTPEEAIEMAEQDFVPGGCVA